MPHTLSDQFDLTGQRPSGFDYLRIGLAAAVAVSHIPAVAYGEIYNQSIVHDGPLRPILMAILPMFFALSGFLVAGSLVRSRKLQTFIGLRIIRLAPALAVEVVLSAIILGPALTALPLAQYFSDREFWTYFLNIVGEIHYTLPGVFDTNPWPSVVNSQLWTIPFELFCYLAITILALFGARRWRMIVPAFALLSTVGFMVRHGLRHDWQLLTFWQLPGLFLIWSFLWGVSFFLYRDMIPWRPWLFWLAVAVSAAALYLDGAYVYVAPLSLTYVTVWLGLTNANRAFFLRGADYSYGVYIYHWVVMQTVISLGYHHWSAAAFIGLPLTIAFAAFSWHVIEKPALEYRRVLLAADAREKRRWFASA